MQLPTMHSPTVNCSQFLSPTNISLPIQSPSNLQSAPITMQPTHYAHFYNQQFPNTSHPPISPFPFNHLVTSSQHFSPCSSPLCTLLQSTVSQFLSDTNISLPNQSPSNIQSEQVTIQITNMHSPTVICLQILLTQLFLPSHSISQ